MSRCLTYLFLLTFGLLASGAPLSAAPPAPEMSAPPEIIVANRPALLVAIDGPPEYLPVKGANPLLWRVANTRVLLLKNAQGRHYLHYYDGYLEAGTLNEPWFVAKKVPPGVILAEQTARASRKINLLEGKPDARTKKKPSLRKAAIPWIYLSMIPAELIVTDGEPDFISIEGTRLFYARNTDANLFWHQDTGALYLLAARFWYRAAEYLGPWFAMPPDRLPPDFRAIPDTSVKRKVKACLPPLPSPESLRSGSDHAWFRDFLTRRPWPAPPLPFSLAPENSSKAWCK